MDHYHQDLRQAIATSLALALVDYMEILDLIEKEKDKVKLLERIRLDMGREPLALNSLLLALEKEEDVFRTIDDPDDNPLSAKDLLRGLASSLALLVLAQDENDFLPDAIWDQGDIRQALTISAKTFLAKWGQDHLAELVHSA